MMEKNLGKKMLSAGRSFYHLDRRAVHRCDVTEFNRSVPMQDSC
jgi:hypothetical protein